MATLTFTGVAKSYGTAPVLRDVSLALEPGRVHALMGENGAGKSTLIKLIAGVVPADAMAVLLGDQPVNLRNAAAALAVGFRFIHQELNVVLQLSVAENVFLGHPWPRRMGALVDWKQLAAGAARALGELGVTHIDPRRHMGDLSVGDRMLVKIAAALVGEPGRDRPILYVMDEPTAALSEAESDRLFAVIARLKAGGAAILYVSHRLGEVMRICDDVTVLRDGRVALNGPIARTDRAGIIAAMTGEVLAELCPPRATPVGADTVARAQLVRSRHLRDVDFTLSQGEILGIAGLAEAGQSQLLELFLGVEALRAGRIELDGTTGPRTPKEAWRRGVAYVPRERRTEGLALPLSVRANMLLPHLRGFGRFPLRSAETSRARTLSREVRLRALGPDQPVGELSGGNQQKVVFARAMAGTPRLLLLDEPTRGVDVGAKKEIYSLIRQISGRGCAILLASTDLPELVSLCDRILVLRDGRQASLIDAAGLSPADLLARFHEKDVA